MGSKPEFSTNIRQNLTGSVVQNNLCLEHSNFSGFVVQFRMCFDHEKVTGFDANFIFLLYTNHIPAVDVICSESSHFLTVKTPSKLQHESSKIWGTFEMSLMKDVTLTTTMQKVHELLPTAWDVVCRKEMSKGPRRGLWEGNNQRPNTFSVGREWGMSQCVICGRERVMGHFTFKNSQVHILWCGAKKLGSNGFLGLHLKMWAWLLLRVKCPWHDTWSVTREWMTCSKWLEWRLVYRWPTDMLDLVERKMQRHALWRSTSRYWTLC